MTKYLSFYSNLNFWFFPAPNGSPQQSTVPKLGIGTAALLDQLADQAVLLVPQFTARSLVVVMSKERHTMDYASTTENPPRSGYLPEARRGFRRFFCFGRKNTKSANNSECKNPNAFVQFTEENLDAKHVIIYKLIFSAPPGSKKN